MVKMSKKYRGVSRTPTTAKKEPFVTLVQESQPFANVIKDSMLDVARVVDLTLR